jgi:hypothetical protein
MENKMTQEEKIEWGEKLIDEDLKANWIKRLFKKHTKEETDAIVACWTEHYRRGNEAYNKSK